MPRNSAKGGQTPELLRQARAPAVSPQIYLLPPVLLSSLDAQDLPLPRQVLEDHDVPGDVSAVPPSAVPALPAVDPVEDKIG